MSAGHLHVNDGLTSPKTIRCFVKDGDGNAITLTGPTITVRFKRPDGTVVDVTATIVGDGSTGEADVSVGTASATVLGLDVPGIWSAQLKDGAGPWYYDVATFEVQDNL